MKLTRNILMWLLAIALILTPALSVNAGTIINPTVINKNGTITGNLTKSKPQQYYKINLSTSGKLTLDMNTRAESTHFFIKDSDGNIFYQTTLQNISSNGHETSEIQLAKGEYILQIDSYKFGYRDSYGSYTVTSSFKSANATYENNISFSKAVTICKGQKIKGHLAVNSNAEYYKVKATKKGKLTVDAKANASYGFVNIYNYNKKLIGELVLKKSQSSGTGSITVPVKKGTYYLEVISDKDFWARKQYGTFTLSAKYPSNMLASGNLKYAVGSGNEAVVKGMIKTNTKKVTIPSTIKKYGKTYKVTKINASAFKGNKNIESVTIGSNVKSIGANAFANCTKVTSLNIKTAKLKSSSIGNGAFSCLGENNYYSLCVYLPKSKETTYKNYLYEKGLSNQAKLIAGN